MRYHFLTLLILFFLPGPWIGFIFVHGQELQSNNESSSLIPISIKLKVNDTKESELDPNKIVDLQALGMIWGYLKYYHPNVANGNLNWDSELVEIIPKILQTKTSIERDQILLEWFHSLGKINSGSNNCRKLKNIKLSPDFNWISSFHFSKELENELIMLKDVPRLDTNVYVSLGEKVMYAEFKNEEAYSSMDFPDSNYRLLSLFRYWNIIQYYFPYKNLIGEDWNSVLHEFIPIFLNAKDKTEYTLSVLKLITRVNDSHAIIWAFRLELEIFLGLYRHPAQVRFTEDELIVTGYLSDSLSEFTQLRVGDIILKINEINVDSIVNKRLDITPGSNLPTKLRDLSLNILRTNNATIEIEFNRDGNALILNEQTYPSYIFTNVQQQSFKLLSDSIAYIDMGTIKNADLDAIWNTVQKTEGLILDLRTYPSDRVMFTIGNFLMPRAKKFVKFTHGSISCAGSFQYTAALKIGERNRNYYKGKVILLVNEWTQSHGEYIAMAFKRALNVTVIGSPTAGADGNLTTLVLPGGILTGFSGIGVYYPNGKETQRIGIIPDVFIKPSINSIKSGKDDLIEAAINLINKS